MLNEFQESVKVQPGSLKFDESSLDAYRCFQGNLAPKLDVSPADANLPNLIFDKEHLDFHKLRPEIITINPDLSKDEKPDSANTDAITSEREAALAKQLSKLMEKGGLDRDEGGRVSKEEIYQMYLNAEDGKGPEAKLTKDALKYLLANYEKVEDESDDEWFGDDDGVTLDDLQANEERIAEGEEWKSGLAKFGETVLDFALIEIFPFRSKTWS